MINKNMYALGANRSCIRELFEYGRQRAAVVGAENVFDYSLGNPSIPAPAGVNEAIQAVLEEMPSLAIHGYTSAPGDLPLRQAVAEDLNARYDAGVRPGDLFIGCGAAPELVSVIRALAVEDSEFIAVAPFFPEYRPFVESSGGKLVVVPADIPNFQIDFAALEAALNANTQAIILNSPNNPAGTVYTAETLGKLAALLERKSAEFGKAIYIISDEPYRELVYGGVIAPWIPGIYDSTIVCYSWSKSLSLPGERIGYVYVPEKCADHDDLYAAVAGAARAGGHVCAPSLIQKVIARCVQLRPDLQAYDENRRLLSDALRSYGYEMAQPDGAFYLFVKSPVGSSKDFSEKAKQHDLLLVPGDDFGCPEYFRICYCVSKDLIERSLPIFEKLIKE
ncbi:MAG: pyridoxal phosphate-dependent aminotransferase [Oscillospiraceae bacterium]|nr:pyridoxal phosphate-dependent aminotransferase [Oscillospiraceae bacterium]